MNKKFPFDTSDLRPSRRDFLRMSGAGLAAAMMARYGMPPGIRADDGGHPR